MSNISLQYRVNISFQKLQRPKARQRQSKGFVQHAKQPNLLMDRKFFFQSPMGTLHVYMYMDQESKLGDI